MLVNKNTEEFLIEYKALCLTHNLYITSCGCCPDHIEIAEEDSGLFGESKEIEVLKHIKELESKSG